MTQTPENTYRIPSPTDKHICRFFESIIQFSGLEIQAQANSGQVPLARFNSVEQAFSKYPANPDRGRIFTSITLSIPGLHIYFHRRVTNFSERIQHEASSLEAEIYLYKHNNNGKSVDEEIFLKILSEIDGLFLESVINDSGPYDTFKIIYAEHISRLSELHESIIREASTERLKRESEYDNRVKNLDEIYNANLKKIKEHEINSISNIELKKKELEEKLLEFDNSSHMHARREMRLKITDNLRDRLAKSAVSRTVGAHRITVLAICGFLGLAFFLSAFFAAYELSIVMEKTSNATIPFYVTSLRLALSVGAIAAVGFYALSFMRKVHDSDLKSERDLERYLYDVDRSSWVIETVLEAKSKDNGQEPAEIPSHWLEGVTHGLFKQSEETQDNDKAMEVLASLFKFSARAKLGPAGPEFEMNNSGARKFGRENLEP